MQETRIQVRRVLIITLVLNFLVAFGKIFIGSVTGALSITADGFHSLMDGTSNIAGLIANHFASRPPDDDHPYGHRRFETLAALLIGALLLVTAWEISSSALDRLQNETLPDFTPLAFAVMVGTLIGNIFISRYQIRRGKQLRSELLLADAANTSTDVFVTASVIISMIVVSVTGWVWVDLVAALVVVLLIIKAAWEVLQQTSRVLVDYAPYSPEDLRNALVDMPVDIQIARARSRGSIDSAHIDIDVTVPPAMTAAHFAAIRESIIRELDEKLGGVMEVEVHFVPDDLAKPDDYGLIVRAAADALGMSTHETRVTENGGQKMLELHVEVPPEQTLADAHEWVNRLEDSLQAQLPEIDEIVTHIEPIQTTTAPLVAETCDQGVLGEVKGLLRGAYPQVRWHHMRLASQPEGLVVTMHAGLAPDVSITEAHDLTESAEALLRMSINGLHRVTIHTEPEEG
ncbi:MAG: cation diffusion facilitator family transporter [Aggregatilineales bacterium]